MKMFSDLPKIYLHRDAIDFRKSINGLVCIVELQMKLSPFDDVLFMFCNKNKDKLKIVFWDKNRFKWPSKLKSTSLILSPQQFEWLLDGFDVVGHQSLIYQSVAL